jgi:hypothetical protein
VRLDREEVSRWLQDMCVKVLAESLAATEAELTKRAG